MITATAALSPYWLNDAPGAPVEVDLQGSDLDDITGAVAVLESPAGETYTLTGSDIEDDLLSFDFPASFVFDEAGLWTLLVTLTGTATLSVEPFGVIVQERNGWHTLASIRREWSAARGIEDEELYRRLEAARMAVMVWGALTEESTVYSNLRDAQGMQTRNTFNAWKASPQGDFGDDTQSYSTFPLDWAVKALIRPPRIPRAH